MSCQAVSYCQTLTAVIECVPLMYQGEDYHFEIQLFDEEGLPLDLDQYSGIFMCLYTDGFHYATYTWPESTGSEPIIILQTETTAGPEDVGLIAFDVSAQQSARFLTGPIYAEIKFRKESETTGGNPVYQTIGCLKIGEVKQAFTKDVTNF